MTRCVGVCVVSTDVVVSHVDDVLQQILGHVTDTSQHRLHLTDGRQLATGRREPLTLHHRYTRILHTHTHAWTYRSNISLLFAVDRVLFSSITRKLYCVEWTQYSIRPNRSAICNRCFPGPTQLLNANGTLITSTFSAGLTRWQTTLLGRSQFAASTYVLKERKSIYTAPFVYYVCQSAQAWITQFYLQMHHAYLSFVSIHKMSPHLTEVGDIQLQLTTHLTTPRDERLSWPGWFNYSRRFTHISGHPSAADLAQDRESSPTAGGEN